MQAWHRQPPAAELPGAKPLIVQQARLGASASSRCLCGSIQVVAEPRAAQGAPTYSAQADATSASEVEAAQDQPSTARRTRAWPSVPIAWVHPTDKQLQVHNEPSWQRSWVEPSHSHQHESPQQLLSIQQPMHDFRQVPLQQHGAETHIAQQLAEHSSLQSLELPSQAEQAALQQHGSRHLSQRSKRVWSNAETRTASTDVIAAQAEQPASNNSIPGAHLDSSIPGLSQQLTAGNSVLLLGCPQSTVQRARSCLGPLIQQVIVTSQQPGRLGTHGHGSVRALLLCSTREAAEQMHAAALAIVEPLGGHVQLLTGRTSLSQDIAQLRAAPADILVATPGRAMQLVTQAPRGFKLHDMLGGVQLLMLDGSEVLHGEPAIRLQVEATVQRLVKLRQQSRQRHLQARPTQPANTQPLAAQQRGKVTWDVHRPEIVLVPPPPAHQVLMLWGGPAPLDETSCMHAAATMQLFTGSIVPAPALLTAAASRAQPMQQAPVAAIAACQGTYTTSSGSVAHPVKVDDVTEARASQPAAAVLHWSPATWQQGRQQLGIQSQHQYAQHHVEVGTGLHNADALQPVCQQQLIVSSMATLPAHLLGLLQAHAAQFPQHRVLVLCPTVALARVWCRAARLLGLRCSEMHARKSWQYRSVALEAFVQRPRQHRKSAPATAQSRHLHALQSAKQADGVAGVTLLDIDEQPQHASSIAGTASLTTSTTPAGTRLDETNQSLRAQVHQPQEGALQLQGNGSTQQAAGEQLLHALDDDDDDEDGVGPAVWDAPGHVMFTAGGIMQGMELPHLTLVVQVGLPRHSQQVSEYIRFTRQCATAATEKQAPAATPIAAKAGSSHTSRQSSRHSKGHHKAPASVLLVSEPEAAGLNALRQLMRRQGVMASLQEPYATVSSRPTLHASKGSLVVQQYVLAGPSRATSHGVRPSAVHRTWQAAGGEHMQVLSSHGSLPAAVSTQIACQPAAQHEDCQQLINVQWSRHTVAVQQQQRIGAAMMTVAVILKEVAWRSWMHALLKHPALRPPSCEEWKTLCEAAAAALHLPRSPSISEHVAAAWGSTYSSSLVISANAAPCHEKLQVAAATWVSDAQATAGPQSMGDSSADVPRHQQQASAAAASKPSSGACVATAGHSNNVVLASSATARSSALPADDGARKSDAEPQAVASPAAPPVSLDMARFRKPLVSMYRWQHALHRLQPATEPGLKRAATKQVTRYVKDAWLKYQERKARQQSAHEQGLLWPARARRRSVAREQQQQQQQQP